MSCVSLAAATAAVAAGIAVVGACAGSAPWTAMASTLAMDGGGHAGQGSSSVHAVSPLYGWVAGLAWHAQAGSAADRADGVQLDSRENSGAQGIVGSLALAARALTQVAGDTGTASHTARASTSPAAAKPSAPRPAAVHPTAPRPHAAPRKPAPAPVHHVQAPPPQPFLVYDSVDPGAIPAGQQVATYATGAYAVPASAVAGRGHVLWIDTQGTDPAAAALDVEPGDATPWQAASWIEAKLSADHNTVAIIYTMIDDWQAVKDSVAGLPQWMQARVRYWIADPTGVPHVLPGSNATQWYWGNNYDISTADPGFES